MKVLFDTSTLISALTPSHQHYSACQPRLDAAQVRRIDGYVSCHTLAEFYRVMTAIKTAPPLTAIDVNRLINDRILTTLTLVSLGEADYLSCFGRLANAQERGGIVYDAIIVQAALKANVDKLLTLNSSHFIRVWPNHADEVINPMTTQAP